MGEAARLPWRGMAILKRRYSRVQALLRAVAGACAAACAVAAVADGALSPFANPVDLQGRYMCPSPGLFGDGTAEVTTVASGNNVIELSGNLSAQENTFTPYSDAYKKPVPQSVDLRGWSFSADVDMGSPSDWIGAIGTEAFVVGQGTNDGSDTTDGVFIEMRYFWNSITDPHAYIRLRSWYATGPWLDTGSYGEQQVYGTFTVRVDVDPSGASATMTISPKPTLLPPILGSYPDIVDTEATGITGPAPFLAGFWSSGTPGTCRGAARLVRLTTSAVAGPTLWLKSTAQFITSAAGVALGATAPQTAEFHLAGSGLTSNIVGFEATGLFEQTVYGFGLASDFVMDPTAIQNQSYTSLAAGPFVYENSRYIFVNPIYNSVGPSVCRIVSGPPIPGSIVVPNYEVAGLTFGPVTPNPGLGQCGGTLSLQLVPNDPNGILGTTGFAMPGGSVSAAYIRGSDTVLCDEVPPAASLVSVTEYNGSTTVPILPASNPAASAFEGDVHVTFSALDQGNLNAPTGSGLGATPQAVVQLQDGNGNWNAYQTLPVFPAGGQFFAADWTVGVNTPCGSYRVQLIATDRVGLQNAPTYSPVFTVQPVQSITVTLILKGLSSGSPALGGTGPGNANNKRLMQFVIGSAPGTPIPPGGHSQPATTVNQLVQFTNGVAVVTLLPPSIPGCDANQLTILGKG